MVFLAGTAKSGDIPRKLERMGESGGVVSLGQVTRRKSADVHPLVRWPDSNGLAGKVVCRRLGPSKA